jgi:hypothetical protein
LGYQDSAHLQTFNGGDIWLGWAGGPGTENKNWEVVMIGVLSSDAWSVWDTKLTPDAMTLLDLADAIKTRWFCNSVSSCRQESSNFSVRVWIKKTEFRHSQRIPRPLPDPMVSQLVQAASRNTTFHVEFEVEKQGTLLKFASPPGWVTFFGSTIRDNLSGSYLTPMSRVQFSDGITKCAKTKDLIFHIGRFCGHAVDERGAYQLICYFGSTKKKVADGHEDFRFTPFATVRAVNVPGNGHKPVHTTLVKRWKQFWTNRLPYMQRLRSSKNAPEDPAAAPEDPDEPIVIQIKKRKGGAASSLTSPEISLAGGVEADKPFEMPEEVMTLFETLSDLLQDAVTDKISAKEKNAQVTHMQKLLEGVASLVGAQKKKESKPKKPKNPPLSEESKRLASISASLEALTNICNSPTKSSGKVFSDAVDSALGKHDDKVFSAVAALVERHHQETRKKIEASCTPAKKSSENVDILAVLDATSKQQNSLVDKLLTSHAATSKELLTSHAARDKEMREDFFTLMQHERKHALDLATHQKSVLDEVNRSHLQSTTMATNVATHTVAQFASVAKAITSPGVSRKRSRSPCSETEGPKQREWKPAPPESKTAVLSPSPVLDSLPQHLDDWSPSDVCSYFSVNHDVSNKNFQYTTGRCLRTLDAKVIAALGLQGVRAVIFQDAVNELVAAHPRR